MPKEMPQKSKSSNVSDKGIDFLDVERNSSEEGDNESNSNCSNEQRPTTIQISPVDFSNQGNSVLVSHVNPIFDKLKALRYQAKEVMDSIGDVETYMRAAADVQEENQRLKRELQRAKEEINLLKGKESTIYNTFSPIIEAKTPRPRGNKISLDTSYSKPSTSICRSRLGTVQTEAWTFTLSDETTVTYRASDYILNEFISTLVFENCKNDIVRFSVQAIADFLRKHEFQNTTWTIVTTGKTRGAMCQLPNAFIHDVVYIATVGFGADPDRSYWTENDYQKFTQALNNTTLTLRDRVAKARSDSRKRKHPDSSLNDCEPTVVNIEVASMNLLDFIDDNAVTELTSENSP